MTWTIYLTVSLFSEYSGSKCLYHKINYIFTNIILRIFCHVFYYKSSDNSLMYNYIIILIHIIEIFSIVKINSQKLSVIINCWYLKVHYVRFKQLNAPPYRSPSKRVFDRTVAIRSVTYLHFLCSTMMFYFFLFGFSNLLASISKNWFFSPSLSSFLEKSVLKMTL